MRLMQRLSHRQEVRYGPAQRKEKVGVPSDRFLPVEQGMSTARIKRLRRQVVAEMARRKVST